MSRSRTAHQQRACAWVAAAATLAVAALGAVATPARAAATQDDPGAAALDAWLHSQAKVQSWSADVTQVRRLEGLVRPLEATGKVWFEQPNRFRWQLGDPPRTIAVRSGDELDVAYPRLHQLEKYTFSEKISASWRQVLALLDVGFPSDPEAFHAQYQLQSAQETDGVWSFHLAPRAQTALQLIKAVDIDVDASSNRLLATALEFPDGSTMRNRFSHIVVNPTIDPSLFHIQVGPDWQVVKPLEGK